MIDWQMIVSGLVGAGIGAIPSWFISRHFAIRSDRGTEATIRPLVATEEATRHSVNVIARMMQQSGTGRPVFDATGNLIGVEMVGTAKPLSVVPQVKGTGTFSPPPKYDRQHEQPEGEPSASDSPDPA